MATQPELMPIEQYLRTSYSPDVDFVDGILEERNLGEYDHSRLTGLLFAYFHPHSKALGVRPLVEQRIRVDTNRVRICDFVMILSSSPREPVTLTAPFLCVEILSPEDRLSRAKTVLTDYLRMGVKHIWLMDPLQRLAYTFDAHGLHEHTGPLALTELNLTVDPQVLFADID